jgi:phosphoserine phosphatase RsbU/P
MHGTVREIALDIVTADGRRLPALVNSVLDHAQDGTPLVIRTAVFDATERRSYERELVAAKQRAEAAEAQANAVARTLQQTLLPPAIPEIPGLHVSAAFQPAGTGAELSGDFWDVFEVGPDDWLVVAGDVCGKGVEAAVVSALARHTVRAAAVRTGSSTEILETLNTVLLGHDSDRYLTAVVLRLRRDDGRWSCTACAAGHPLPLLRRAGAATPVGRPGSVVGLFPDPTFTEVPTDLVPGDALVLYTDGITEARAPEGAFFGEERLRRAVERHPAAAGFAEAVLGEALAFQRREPRDDAAVVVVTVA